MKRLISEEIAQKEVELLEKAMEKERCFYNFLNGIPLDLPYTLTSQGDVDKVCFTAFCKSNLHNVKEIIEKYRQMRISKGVHFTSNLMNICAFALCSEDVKEKELNEYWASHGVFEKFIISKIFPKYSLGDDLPKKEIEELINTVFTKNNTENVTDLLALLVGRCTELTEFFVLNKTFQKLCEIHPNLEIEKKHDFLVNEITTLIAKKEKQISLVVNWGFIVFGIIVIPSVIYFVKSQWTTYDLEPLLSGWGLVSPIITTIIVLFLRIKPEYYEIIERLKIFIFRKYNPKLSAIRDSLNP